MHQAIIIDIESTGLGVDTFPVEFGWSFLRDGDFGGSFLINPQKHVPDYVLLDCRVHGVSLEEIRDHGIIVPLAVSKIQELNEMGYFYSDAPEFDQYWLSVLFSACGGADAVPKVRPISDLYAEGLERFFVNSPDTAVDDFLRVARWAEHKYPHLHRAYPDTLAPFNIAKCLFDKDFFEVVVSENPDFFQI